MVHPFYYDHEGRKIHFLWDSESGSLHNVDSAAFLVAKNRFASLSEAENAAWDKLPSGLKEEIDAELSALQKAGVLNTPPPPTIPQKSAEHVKAVCVHICHDCNLRCSYCFADEGSYHKKCKEYMSVDVGRAAVDFLIRNSGSRKNLEMDFFGGEPLLNLDTVKQIVDYANLQAALHSKSFSFTMTTNCLLLNEENARYLDATMSNVILSIDGRRHIHNAVRKTPNGKDVFDVILKNARRFVEIREDRPYYIRGTFTAQNLDFSEDILFLLEEGFCEISLEPVVTDIAELKIDEAHAGRIAAEYERVAALWLQRRANGKPFTFFHFMLDLDHGPCLKKRLSGCGSGCEYLSVLPNGDIYPCHQFANQDGFYMGNVLKDDFSRAVSTRFAANIVTGKERCKDCFAKYYCSGGCAANNHFFAGSMEEPYAISCEMMKKRLELALAIQAIEKVGT